MRMIYVDEAGISDGEPVAIVAGVIVDADFKYQAVEDELARLQELVPEHHREGFIFHATKVWGDAKYREGWSREDRFDFLCRMMSVPRRLHLAVSMGLVWERCDPPEGVTISRKQFHHALALGHCLSRADKCIRERGRANEIAMVVAEDMPANRKVLKALGLMARERPLTFEPHHLHPTAAEIAAGREPQPQEFRIERIRDEVHFAEKRDAPLLQIADACAFAFRRYFARQSSGEEMMRAAVGWLPNRNDFKGPSSATTYGWTDPPKTYFAIRT